MGGLREDYIFLLQGSLSTCSTALPPHVCLCTCTCEHEHTSYMRRGSLNVTRAASPHRPASFFRCALCILKNSLTLFCCPSSMLFPQNVQSSGAVCVLSKTISLSQVQLKLNSRQITGRLWSFSIQESRQLWSQSDSLSFLNSIPEQAWTFFFFA